MIGPCPACQVSAWTPPRTPHGAVGCQRCGGHLMPGHGALQLVQELGIDPTLIPQLARDLGRRGKSCPACAATTQVVPLKGVDVDWCPGCGTTWFDRGELERLSPQVTPVSLAPAEGAPPPGPGPARAGAPAAPVSSAAAMAPLAGRAVARAGEALQAFFGSLPIVQIRQKVELGEALLGFEQSNKYAIDLGDRGVGYALEEQGGWWGILRRQLLRSHRPLDVAVHDPSGHVTLSLSRPFFFFFSELRVEAADGTLLGYVRRRFSVLYKKYDLCDARGMPFAHVKAAFWRIWKFPIVDVRGQEVGAIQKRWSGMLKEMFTDADNFTVDFGQAVAWPLEQRAVLFSAALSIDMDFFDDNQRR